MNIHAQREYCNTYSFRSVRYLLW